MILLISGGIFLATVASPPPTAWLVYIGGIIAWASLVANVWLQRRQSRAQATLHLLTLLRLDREYLDIAKAYRAELPNPRSLMPESTFARVTNPKTESDKTLRQAVLWLINSYEFLAPDGRG